MPSNAPRSALRVCANGCFATVCQRTQRSMNPTRLAQGGRIAPYVRYQTVALVRLGQTRRLRRDLHGMKSTCGHSMEHEITTARRWRIGYSLVFSLMVAVVVVTGFLFTRPHG